MFQDIISNQNNLITMNMVKASPSVNSPNDGAFNSEENARWANKKITTKPYIVGKDEAEVAKSFGDDIIMAGYSCYTGDAMFSIDGYLFKLANTGRTSYDYPYQSSGGPGIDCAYIQRFVSGLTNYGTENELGTTYSSFLFSEYDPSIVTPGSSLTALWDDACEHGTVVGFAKNVYVDSYKDALTISGPSNKDVSYEGTTITCDLNIEPTDQNDNVFQNATEPLGIIKYDNGNVSSIIIYYPVTIKKVRYYDYTSKEYKYDYRLTFTDIFSVDFVFGTTTCRTNTYPYTQNAFSSMTENNEPLSSISFTNCKLKTFSKTLYDPMNLYVEDGGVYKRIQDSPVTSINTVSDFNIESFFNVYTISDLMNYMPDTVPQQTIPYIKNNVKYYCFKESLFSDNAIKITVGSNEVSVPVAFMTSNGSTCPDGFACDDVGLTLSPNYPVEGYLHFIKRLYCKISQSIANPSEDDINSVTLDDLLHWNSGTTNFNTFYDIFYKYVCLYAQLSYSSLLENSVLTTDETSTSTKAKGCGIALQSFCGPTITWTDFVTYQDYDYTGYQNVDGSLEQSQFTVKLPYDKQISSDSYKVRNGLLLPTGTQQTIYKDYVYRESVDFTGNINMLLFEDPLNFIMRSTSSTKPGFAINSAWIYTGSALTSKSLYTNPVNLVIDDYLFPVIQSNGSHYLSAWFVNNTVFSEFNRNSVSASFCNGFKYEVGKYSWFVNIPYVVNITKDSLNYLSGKSYLTGNYNGLDFKFVLGNKYEDNDLLLLKYIGSSVPSVTAYDTETFNNGVNTKDIDIKTQREAYIHISKIYDDNNEGLGLIINDIRDDIQDVKDAIGQGVENLGQRVKDLEDSVNGTQDTEGLLERVNDIEDTLYDETTGLVTKVSSIQETLSDACLILETGALSDPEDEDSDVTYTIYGKYLTSGHNTCIISGYGNIGDFDAPWDEPAEGEELYVSPLIGKHIYSVIIQPGIKGTGSSVFCFSFNDLTIASSCELSSNLIGSEEGYILGPKCVNIQEGALGAQGHMISLNYSNIVSINLPKSLYTRDPSESIIESNLRHNIYLTTVNCNLPFVMNTFFDGCVSLKNVTLNETYKLGNKPFIGCTSLKNLYYQGTKTQWNSITKGTSWDVTEEEGGVATKHLEKIFCYDGVLVYDSGTDTWIDQV